MPGIVTSPIAGNGLSYNEVMMIGAAYLWQQVPSLTVLRCLVMADMRHVLLMHIPEMRLIFPVKKIINSH